MSIDEMIARMSVDDYRLGFKEKKPTPQRHWWYMSIGFPALKPRLPH